MLGLFVRAGNKWQFVVVAAAVEFQIYHVVAARNSRTNEIAV